MSSIIHILPFYSDEASGPSYSAMKLCERLVASGEAVKLVAVGSRKMQSPPPFLRFFPLSKGPKFVEKIRRSEGMKHWLKSQAAAGNIKLIHSHNLWTMPNIYAGEIAGRFNIPLVFSPHGTLSDYAFNSGSKLKRLFWPLLQKPALEKTVCFHATGEGEYLDIRRKGFSQPVAIIPNGIDIPAYEDCPKSDVNMRTLLYLGRLHPEKGLELLLLAWEKVFKKFPQWRLRLVGPNRQGYLLELQKLAANLKLERIDFDDALYGEDKLSAYRCADLYILPSPSENFGITVAEALVAGTPVITTKGAPWRALIQRGIGWWTDISVDSLATALEEALSMSPLALQKMGGAGREWAMQTFNWDRIGRDITLLYDWVLLKMGEKPDFLITD